MSDFLSEFQPVVETVDATNAAAKNKHMAAGVLLGRSSTGAARLPSSSLFVSPSSVRVSKLLHLQASSTSPLSSTMPNLLKDLVAMVSPQAKRPLQSPSTTNRLSPAKQNVASGPFADLAARRENASAGVTVEQQQQQAKMDAFVYFNVLR